MSDTRIYVACLASYNNGTLHGSWIDLDGKDADDIQAEVNAMLRASPFPNVMVPDPDTAIDGPGRQSMVPSAEEWAIHDYEGFAGIRISEGQSFDDIAALAEILCNTNDDDDQRRGLVWLISDRGFTISEATSRADDVRTFTGDSHDLAGDYAYELAGDTIENFEERSSQWPFTCIDWARAGRELTLGGDVDETTVEGTRFLVTNASEF